MSFPAHCVKKLADYVRGKAPLSEALLCFSSLLAYFFFRVSDHEDQPVIGATSEVSPAAVFDLANSLSMEVPKSGLLDDWLIRVLLPMVIDRMLDAEAIKDAVDFLANELRRLISLLG